MEIEGWLKYDGRHFKVKWSKKRYQSHLVQSTKMLSVPFGPIDWKVITPIWSEVEKSYHSHLVPPYSWSGGVQKGPGL